MTDTARQRDAVLRLADRLGLWMALFDRSSRLVDTSPALGRALAGGAAALQAALHRVATAALAHAERAPEIVELRCAAWQRFRLRAVPTLGELQWLHVGALVLVEPLTDPAERDDASEWAHYRFTPRELDVARLLARGLAAEHIASALSVSRHTARRHIESIEAKLSVHSRAEAAVTLLRARSASTSR